MDTTLPVSAPDVPAGYGSIDVGQEIVSVVLSAIPEGRRREIVYRNSALLAPLDLLAPLQAALGDGAQLADAERRRTVRLAIAAERDRRIAADIAFQGVVFQNDEISRARIDKSRTSALAAILSGAPAGDLRWHGLPVDFFWIAADNSRLPMDAQAMVAFGNAVAAREGLLIVAANNLKLLVDGGETIMNVADDALWPA